MLSAAKKKPLDAGFILNVFISSEANATAAAVQRLEVHTGPCLCFLFFFFFLEEPLPELLYLLLIFP